jgi:hypothetical protein
MSSIVDIIKDAILLTSDVAALKDEIKRLNAAIAQQKERYDARLSEMGDRLTRLEGSAELIAEKSKNAALTAVALISRNMGGPPALPDAQDKAR